MFQTLHEAGQRVREILLNMLDQKVAKLIFEKKVATSENRSKQVSVKANRGSAEVRHFHDDSTTIKRRRSTGVLGTRSQHNWPPKIPCFYYCPYRIKRRFLRCQRFTISFRDKPHGKSRRDTYCFPQVVFQGPVHIMSGLFLVICTWGILVRGQRTLSYDVSFLLQKSPHDASNWQNTVRQDFSTHKISGFKIRVPDPAAPQHGMKVTLVDYLQAKHILTRKPPMTHEQMIALMAWGKNVTRSQVIFKKLRSPDLKRIHNLRI